MTGDHVRKVIAPCLGVKPAAIGGFVLLAEQVGPDGAHLGVLVQSDLHIGQIAHEQAEAMVGDRLRQVLHMMSCPDATGEWSTP